jgi:hypothetical protein
LGGGGYVGGGSTVLLIHGEQYNDGGLNIER